MFGLGMDETRTGNAYEEVESHPKPTVMGVFPLTAMGFMSVP